MSHHDDGHSPHSPYEPEPTIQARLWGTQERLHDIARALDRPGPHGVQYAAEIYDVLGALSVATRDIAEIIRRATRLLTDASDQALTSRPYSLDDDVWLRASAIYARMLVGTLDSAQTSIRDMGGYLLNSADTDSGDGQQRHPAE